MVYHVTLFTGRILYHVLVPSDGGTIKITAINAVRQRQLERLEEELKITGTMVNVCGSKGEVMTEYHQLCTEWSESFNNCRMVSSSCS